jgi:hypothetical protein
MTPRATIPADPVESPGADFWFLRSEGIRLLERLTGDTWTDYNLSDPGVTLLEVLCYAIADLSYRAGHSVADLLAENGRTGTLPSAAHVLPCVPVTAADLRRLALDVDGVRNAWVEPVQGASPPLYYTDGTSELGFRPDPPSTQPVVLRGLYRVLVEQSDRASSDVTAAVASRLHACRGIGEDFDEIRVLPSLPVRLTATVEIDVVDRPADVLQGLYEVAAEYFSPTLSFRSLPEMFAAGYGMDEIFEGPLLEHGFIDPQELAAHTRRATARSSDLIAAFSAVPGVRAVQSFRMDAGSVGDDWALELPADSAPVLDLAESAIQLVRGQSPVTVDLNAVAAAVIERRRVGNLAARPQLVAQLRDRTVPTGRSRGVARYRSVQHELPHVYGVGEFGLAREAPPERRAAAHQLQAYLLLFDQPLASAAAQLASVGDLLAAGDAPGTYATQVPDPGPWMEEVLEAPADYGAKVAQLTEVAAGDPEHGRRNRFLSHLLARQGEQFPEYGAEPGRSAADKALLLAALPRLSERRATGVDYLLPPSAQNRSGLEERISHKLGLVAEDGEVLTLVEHILLRPVARDGRTDMLPFLERAERDPFSLRISFLLPQRPPRFAPGSPFRDVVTTTLRAESPAHLRVQVRWLDEDDYTAAREANDRFLAARGRQYRSDLGLGPVPA